MEEEVLMTGKLFIFMCLLIVIAMFGVYGITDWIERRAFIDQCIVDRYENTELGEVIYGAKDYCNALWRLR